MKHAAKIAAVAITVGSIISISSAPATASTPTLGVSQAGASLTFENAHSRKCLEVENSEKGNGARVQQWDCKGQAGSRWVTYSFGNGYYQIVNSNSNKCLEIVSSRTDNGAPAQQWDCKPSLENQIWKWEMGEGFGNRLINKRSGKVLEIIGGSIENGARAQQYESAQVPQQKWRVLLNG
ncbi:RICIN domain-containing protein [Streptomyces sp. URMC 127]|uniref:RICIN domain-containing protein n=1 Tax=Streptomyces sp. URMC 127 TaxID=3423402 RepID=UPI003F1ABAFB